MQYDQYGRPMQGSFHAPDNTQAKIHMPNIGEMGGKGEVPFVRFPITQHRRSTVPIPMLVLRPDFMVQLF